MVPLRAIAVIVVGVLLAAADGDPDRRPGVVAEVIDGDTIVLTDGREIRLVGIQAPKLPLGRAEFRAWPLAGAAKDAMEDLAGGRRVSLSFTGRRVDRHGRWLAHLHDDGGTWLQGTMLEHGLARVYTFADNDGPIDAMLALERTARDARRGIWGHPYYDIRTPASVTRDVGSFQLVEGQVLDAAIVRGRAYLNFGPDWKTDFTVTMAPDARRRFEDAGIDLTSLAGHRVRARGWIKSYNGPMIEATHPHQLEILD
ncbi:MAG: thermonuclease family protein [Alphaproteobacteria bacterium]|nr:thermonuclease family protein [Alphaproteobacteria bacterium]